MANPEKEPKADWTHYEKHSRRVRESVPITMALPIEPPDTNTLGSLLETIESARIHVQERKRRKSRNKRHHP